MRILVVNPLLSRLSALGACEQDRLANIADLTRLGHEVHLVTQGSRNNAPDEHRAFYATRGIAVSLLPYAPARLAPARFRDLAYLDGAAWEYATPGFMRAVDTALDEFRPDLVWCHATYVWPPAVRARQRGLPVVVRSVNYESIHMLQEDGRSFANILRYIGKEIGERRAVGHASVLAAITPDEQALYQRVAPRSQVHLLPLRTLPRLLRPPHTVRALAPGQPIRVFSMGASYNVPHNRAALEFVVHQIVPRVRALAPGQFEFHVMGGKTPEAVRQHAAPDLVFDGFVDDLEAHLGTMDIALAPSRFGQGMQQKVFEPLCRGIPTVASRRALAGYTFEHGIHALLADAPDDATHADQFAAHIIQLGDATLRGSLARGASAQAAALFSQGEIDARLDGILRAALA